MPVLTTISAALAFVPYATLLGLHPGHPGDASSLEHAASHGLGGLALMLPVVAGVGMAWWASRRRVGTQSHEQ